MQEYIKAVVIHAQAVFLHPSLGTKIHLKVSVLHSLKVNQLTVQKRVSVIVTLSGQNTLSALIYPKLVVYPRGVCTHNEGSFGPPWGLQGAPQKMTPFIVVKL